MPGLWYLSRMTVTKIVQMSENIFCKGYNVETLYVLQSSVPKPIVFGGVLKDFNLLS